MKHILKNISAAALALSLGGAAFAVTIDFQSLEHNDALTTYHGFSYAEDGFTLDNLSQGFAFGTFGTSESRYSGSTALFNDTIGGLTRLTQTGGGNFALNSIDLAELNGGFQATVTFNAYSGVSLLGSQSFTLDGSAFAAQTFYFNAFFANVDRVEWTQDSPFHQFDNIVVNESGNPVPDAGSTFALMGLALVGLSFFSRKLRA